MNTRARCHLLATAVLIAVALQLILLGRVRSHDGLLACIRGKPLSLVPTSSTKSRAPSVPLERLAEKSKLPFSILPEPVERPLGNYLYKRDPFYKRIVPDWNLQFRTAEQEYRTEGDFSVLIREITDEGAIVQDAVTGLFGFVPESELGAHRLVLGGILHNAKCTYMDSTVFMSCHVKTIRLQTGVVYEWDNEKGEGYILPTEGQDAWHMIRVFRRDIDWHDSRVLFVGQFVQFETALPDEVPIAPNDEPQAPFALRVRSPEVQFSLLESETHERGSPARWQSRPRSTHPVLGRFLDSAPEHGHAQSPAWLWEAPIRFEETEKAEKEEFARIVPLKLRKLRPWQKPVRIAAHEVAMQAGDLWKEPAMRRSRRLFSETMPPSRKEQEMMSVEHGNFRIREKRRQIRREKLRAASQRRA